MRTTGSGAGLGLALVSAASFGTSGAFATDAATSVSLEDAEADDEGRTPPYHHGHLAHRFEAAVLADGEPGARRRDRHPRASARPGPPLEEVSPAPRRNVVDAEPRRPR